ncbi:MAG: TniQ family protein, partial [Rhodocyclaceae bacterium]|nr:TniQ family protein [Rhodocyclaceae bacterium]
MTFSMFSAQTSLWPIHPKPFDGEILSSWLSRIGDGLGLSLYQFRKLCLPKTVGESSDIDQITNPDFFEALSRGAGITADQARRTGFVSDEGRVYSRLVFNNLEWIAPLSIMDKGRRRASLPFCPSCLATDKVPYYRKHWRYGFHPVCPEHGLLTNLCPECQQHYVYVGPDQTGGVNVPSGVIGVCRQCETRFRRTTIPGLEHSVLQLVTEIQA